MRGLALAMLLAPLGLLFWIAVCWALHALVGA